jgi:glycosyltransferase involved in cell wall biosynthesis
MSTGGAEKLLLDLLPVYAKRGQTVDLLTLNANETPFLQQLRDAKSNGIFSLGGSVYNPLHVFRLMKFLRKYDVVHVHLFPSLYWVALAKLLSRSKAKIVYTEHCTTNWRMEQAAVKPFDRFIYRLYDRIVCISGEVKNAIAPYAKGDPGKYVVIENGVDLSKIKNAEALQKADLGLKPTDKVVIQVSRFQPQKDQKTAIRAVKDLAEDVHLMLVGEGEELEPCKKLAAELQIAHRVHFMGVRMDVPRLLKTADVVLLSSHFEGLSLSSIEGMASGKPFIASNVPGLGEVVSGAGLLFEESDEKALAENISRVLSDGDFRQKIVSACLQRAANYDISVMANKHLDLYSRL